MDAVPTAGPYYVAAHVPGRSLVLRRNPNYSGPRPSRLAEIRYRTGVPPKRAVAAVEAGRADYMEINSPSDPAVAAATAARLEQRYGARSQAARTGRQQLFTQPAPNIYFFLFNTRREPFADVRLRRAVNFAMDRRALAANTGLGEVGRPTDQHIPPGLPGFEDAAIYPLGGPDLRRRAGSPGGERRRAVLYTCDFPGVLPPRADTEIEPQPRSGSTSRCGSSRSRSCSSRLQRPGEPYDIGYSNWFFDYADPFSYINVQFGDEGFFHGSARGPPLAGQDGRRGKSLG